ncbi:hypothetical protein [Burkholderia cenocepacia]|uniref:hypothetical protein n=1 Tax=Burkholderia cenocepacia TaxID=95486 RepID=UPI000CFFBF5F|nr:hypothetical protein [Burkholderia cenocepacia]PRG73383.1 hypothetical protein C6T64_10900 [Burkholderia cenocepacia]
MTTNTYGGYIVDQLREFIRHHYDAEHGGDNIDELTNDSSASVNIVRDLLDAIEPQQDGDLLRPIARWVYNAVRVNLDLLHGICSEFGCPQGEDVATWLRARLAGVPVPCTCTGVGPCEKRTGGSCRRERAAASAPADDRAAFEWPLLPLLPEAVITTADGEAVFTAHQMQGYANAYGEMVRARASSANETEAESVRAWATDDGRVISNEQKQQALRDGGASASSVRPYAQALGRIAPAQAAESMAIPAGWTKLAESARSLRGLYHNTHCNPEGFRLAVESLADDAAKLLRSPPPSAAASAPVGLTEEQIIREFYMHTVMIDEPLFTFDRSSALALAHTLLATQQPEPRVSAGVIAAAIAVVEADRAQTLTTGHIDALDNAIKIQSGDLALPEPCPEASPDDQRDGMRWRALMKDGEPEVFVERTQRRTIQRTQPVAFSSPNLTGADRVDTPSEMWVKRYVMFAWWARENEHRKFIEAVDAISAGEIQ